MCPGGTGSRPPASCPKTGCSWRLSSCMGGGVTGQRCPRKHQGVKHAWSLPIIAPVDGVDQLLIHQAGMVLTLPLPARAAGAAEGMSPEGTVSWRGTVSLQRPR